MLLVTAALYHYYFSLYEKFVFRFQLTQLYELDKIKLSSKVEPLKS